MADHDDLKPLLMRLMAVVEGTAGDVTSIKQDVTSLKQDVTSLKQDVTSLKQDVTDIKAELKVMNTRLDGFEKRLDDQGRILAALVPTRIAAVPPPAAE